MIDHRPVVNTDDLIDEGHARGVDSREVEEFALHHHADVFETSAKTAEDVDELFFNVAQGSFTWRVDRHRYAPPWMKQAVLMMTMIRSLHHESAISLLPNELLFEIFSWLRSSSRLVDAS